MIEPRKEQILKAVVEEYTETGLPVGSQSLASRHFQNLSAATIRNELAELVETGYLAQPHTSAGRVPSDLGYRHFVDYLMQEEPVPPQVGRLVRERVRGTADVGHVIDGVAALLAQLTRAAALVTMPHTPGDQLKHADVVHDGVRDLLRQPEFVEVERVRELVWVIEEAHRLAALLESLVGDSGIQVVIGCENEWEPLRRFSVLVTTYGQRGRLWGTMGLIGPTRMRYSQAVSHLRQVAQTTGQMLNA
jgi:transcriptional regulator of heat shock response